LLARRLADLSRSRLKALIEAGTVAVDGHTIRDPSHRVNSGAAIKVDVPPARPARPGPEPIPLNVVYEDDDIIVIDKPAGLVVHPAAGNWTGTLVNALIAHCGDSLSGVGGERRPGIVHRLDKDTTGLMVVAKNDRAHAALAAQFADHGRSGAPFERGYLAFVWGAPDRPHGRIDRPIDRDPRARDRMAVREAAARPLPIGRCWNVTAVQFRNGHGRSQKRPISQALSPVRLPVSWPAGWKPAGLTRFGSIWPQLAMRSLAIRFMGPGCAPRRRFCRMERKTPSRPLADRPFMPISCVLSIR